MAVVNQVGNALTGSTGTGAFVGDNTPTLVTPNIGAATGTSLSVSGAIASTASTITAGTNVFLTQAAATARLVSLTGNQTNTGQLNLQAGPGSATYGGAMTLYGNAHATLPGYVNVGLSNNASTPKFTITSNPFSGGSEVFSVNNVGTTIVAGSLTTSQTAGIIGTTTNNDAAALSVGQLVSSVIVAGSAVSLTTATPANVTSISLTAGDWDVWGNVTFIPAATTNVVQARGWISSTSITEPDASLYSGIQNPAAGEVPAGNFGFGVPSQRLSLAGTTTIYMSVTQAFTVDTLTVCGGIYARRRR